MTSKLLICTQSSKRKAEKLQKLLEEKACTVHEIAKHLICERSTATKYIRYFKAKKTIFVESYEKPISPFKIKYPTPKYRWGEKRKSAKVPCMTGSERLKLYRKSIKAQPEKYQEYLMKKKKKRLIQKLDKKPPMRDPLVGALFGAAR